MQIGLMRTGSTHTRPISSSSFKFASPSKHMLLVVLNMGKDLRTPKSKAHNTSAIPFTLQHNTTSSIRLQDDLQWTIPCRCHTSTNLLSCSPMSSPIAYTLPKTYACKLWDTAELLNNYICWRSVSMPTYRRAIVLEVPVQRSFICYSKVIVVYLYKLVQTDLVCS